MNEFQIKLKKLMDEYVHFVYWTSKRFPREEMFGLVSQFRRASMSVVLNYIEGYARRKTLVRLNHLETAYGSFQESKYILDFSLLESYITKEEYQKGEKLANEIGAMLWTELTNLEKSIKRN